MKVSCLQENLAKGLSIVGRAVATRSTLPVLSNILLATDQGRLKLSATNLEIGITCWIGGKVEEDGATTIPARTFVDLVGALPAERVDMELVVRTQTLNLKCGRFENTSGALTPPSSRSSPPPPTPMPSALAHPHRVIP
jgi:DNA polymerase-3 subunit beta